MVTEICTHCRAPTELQAVYTHNCVNSQDRVIKEIYHLHCIKDAFCSNCNTPAIRTYEIFRNSYLATFCFVALIESIFVYNLPKLTQSEFYLGFWSTFPGYAVFLIADKVEHLKILAVAVSTIAFNVLSQRFTCDPLVTTLGVFSAWFLMIPLLCLYSPLNPLKLREWPIYATTNYIAVQAFQASANPFDKFLFGLLTLTINRVVQHS